MNASGLELVEAPDGTEAIVIVKDGHFKRTTTIAMGVPAVLAIAGAVTTVGGIAGNVTTVAGLSANIVTLAGIAGNIAAIANDITKIDAVANDLALGAGSHILAAPQAALDAAAAAGLLVASGVSGRPASATLVTGSNPNASIITFNDPAVTTRTVSTVDGWNLSATAKTVTVQRRTLVGGNFVLQGTPQSITTPATIGAYSVALATPLVVEPGEYTSVVLPSNATSYVTGGASDGGGYYFFSGSSASSIAAGNVNLANQPQIRLGYTTLPNYSAASLPELLSNANSAFNRASAVKATGRPRGVALVTGSAIGGTGGGVITFYNPGKYLRLYSLVRVWNLAGTDKTASIERRTMASTNFVLQGGTQSFIIPAGPGEKSCPVDFFVQPGESVSLYFEAGTLPATATTADGTGYYRAATDATTIATGSVITTSQPQVSLEYREIYDADTVLDLDSADNIMVLGESIPAQVFSLPRKGWLGCLSASTDWRYSLYAVGDYASATMITDLTANTPRFGTLGPRDYRASHALFLMGGADSNAGVTLATHFDHMRQLVDIKRGWGATPFITSHYFPGWWGGENAHIGKAEAEQLGAAFIDVAPLGRMMGNGSATGTTAHWLADHPNLRTSKFLYQGFRQFIETLGRPTMSMKIFRVRPEVTVSTVADLYYSSFDAQGYGRRGVLDELQIGQYALASADRKYWDDLGAGFAANGLPVTAYTDEYGTLQGGGTVSFTDYAVIELVLPTTAKHLRGDMVLQLAGLSGASLYIPDNAAGQYVGPLTSATADYPLSLALLQNAMRFDKLIVVVQKSGAFSFTGSPRLLFKTSGTPKPAVAVRDLTRRARGAELLTSTSFPTSGAPGGAWTVIGTVTCIATPDDPVPPVYNNSGKGLAPIDATNYLTQTCNVTNDPLRDVEAEVRIVVRNHPAAFSSASSYPSASPVTETSFDLVKLFLGITSATGVTPPLLQWDAVDIGFEEIVFRTVIPAGTPTISLMIKPAAALQLATVSFKTMDA